MSSRICQRGSWTKRPRINMYVSPDLGDSTNTPLQSAHTRSTVLDPLQATNTYEATSAYDSESLKALTSLDRLTAPATNSALFPYGTDANLWQDRTMPGMAWTPMGMGGTAPYAVTGDGPMAPHLSVSPLLTNGGMAYGVPVMPTAPMAMRQPYTMGYPMPVAPVPVRVPGVPDEEGSFPVLNTFVDSASNPTSDASRASLLQDSPFQPDDTETVTQSTYSTPQALYETSAAYPGAVGLRRTTVPSRSRSPSPRWATSSSRWDEHGNTSIMDFSKRGNTSATSKSRPFVCSYCSRAFARKHDLERHARVHVRMVACADHSRAIVRTFVPSAKEAFRGAMRCGATCTYWMRGLCANARRVEHGTSSPGGRGTSPGELGSTRHDEEG